MKATSTQRVGPAATVVRLLLVGLVALIAAPMALAQTGPAADWPTACTVEDLDGQRALLCLPEAWNGLLVLYAHGYVSSQDPLALPADELNGFTLEDGRTLIELLLEQDIAFVTTSFSKNGYAVEQAGEDLNALVDRFGELTAPEEVQGVFLVGVSQGGLITVQQVERYPETYHGGLAICGPIGGAAEQIRYLNDFRVVFDFFFPEVFDFGATDVPEEAFLAWGDYVDSIGEVVSANPEVAEQLIRVTGAAWDPLDRSSSLVTTTVNVLRYSVWGTNDLIETAGGIAYDNRLAYRVYRGSEDDVALNAGVERVTGEAQAQEYLEDFYQPNGALQRPLVVLHTARDPEVPFQHVWRYAARAIRAGRGRLVTVLRVSRYGHCNFTAEEVVDAFALLVYQTTGVRISSP